jgi:uncharacterized protein
VRTSRTAIQSTRGEAVTTRQRNGEASSRPYAVVTGASSGIGLELARQFADNGFDLVVAADGAELQEAAASLRDSGADVHAVQVDLATFEGVETLYAAITAAGRPVAAAALNAGVGVWGASTRCPSRTTCGSSPSTSSRPLT